MVPASAFEGDISGVIAWVRFIEMGRSGIKVSSLALQETPVIGDFGEERRKYAKRVSKVDFGESSGVHSEGKEDEHLANKGADFVMLQCERRVVLLMSSASGIHLFRALGDAIQRSEGSSSFPKLGACKRFSHSTWSETE